MKFISDFLKLVLKNIFYSFTAGGDSWSARKLTAFVFVIFILYIHIKYVNENNAFDILIIDITSVLLLLSVITIEQIIRLKIG